MNKHHPVALSLLILSAFLLTLSLPPAGHTAPPWKDFEQPNAENDKDKNKGKGPPGEPPDKNQGDTLVICHRPPVPETASDTAQQKEIERVIGAPAWKAHEKHGDSKGPCGAVRLERTVNVDPSNGLVQSAHLDSEGNLSVAVGSKKLLFYENGELSRSVDRLQHSHVYVSQTEENYVAETTKTGWRLYDSKGNLVNTPKTPNIRGTNNALVGSILVGSNRLEGPGGFTAAYDLTTGDELWSVRRGTECCGGIGRGGSDDYVLFQSRKDPLTYQVRDIRTGDTVASLEGKPIVTGGVSENNTYVFATHSGELAVYDMDFDELASWDQVGLPEILPVQPVELFESRQKAITTIPDQGIVVGDINTLSADTFAYPQAPFPSGRDKTFTAKDSGEGLFFISGFNGNFDEYSEGDAYKTLGRSVFVFDLEKQSFVDSIQINSEQLDFSSFSYEEGYNYYVPSLNVIDSKNLLVINLPTQVKTYHYGD